MKTTGEETAKKKKGKKRRRRAVRAWITVFLVLAVTTGALFGFYYIFPVKSVTAVGSDIYTDKQIIRASGIDSKDNVLLVSQESVEKKIREKLPYVDSVIIERKLPDGIKIKVKDAAEYAAFRVKNKYYAVSERGYVLNIYHTAPENAIEVICPDRAVSCKVGQQIVFSKENAKSNCQELFKLLGENEIVINSIDVSNPVSLTATIEGRFKVLFGTSADLDKKVAHLAGMCKSIARDKTGRINLSMWTSEKTEGSFVEGEFE